MGIAEILALTLKFLKKYWPYILIAGLTVTVAILWSMFSSEREAHNRTEADKQRWIGNSADLYRDASSSSQTITLQRGEIDRIPGLERELDSTAQLLGIRTKDLRRVHRLVSSSVIRDTVRIGRDTVLLPGGETQFVETIPINFGCATGTATRIAGNDTAWTDGYVRTDLTIVDFVEKSKGYLARDVKRFFTLRWKQMGIDKWDARVEVRNNCDTSQKWEKNIIFDIPKKK